MGFPGGSVVKNLLANGGAPGDTSLIPGSGKSSGGGNVNPLQYSCLKSSMDRSSLAVYSLWCCKEFDMTERLSMHTCICIYTNN